MTRRLKILQLITHLEPGGAQETVVLLAEGLREHGHDVTVGARLVGAVHGRLDDAGVALVDVPHMVRSVSPVDDARAYLEVRRLMRTERYDVVHTHSSKAGVIGRLAARRAHVPAIVHTSHGLPVNPDMSTLERDVLLAAERAAARASDRVVAVSHATADELLQLRLARREQIAIIPSGIDLARFRSGPSKQEARATLGLPSDGPVAGWVGRHFAQKRPEVVLEMARQLVSQVPRASFLMVGDGPTFHEALTATANDERIHVLGYRDDIETAYAAMDVFVLASAWEGLPRTVLEAGAAGVPVVATDVSGVVEIVRDGETGRLLEPGSWTPLAEALIRLLSDPGEIRRMGENIQALIGVEYSARHMTDATVALYIEALEQRTESALGRDHEGHAGR